MSRHIFETAKESGLPASAPQYSKWLQNPWWLLVRYVLWWSIFILKIGDHIDSHMLSYVTIHYIHRFMMKLSLKWIIIICYISLIYLIYIYIHTYIYIYIYLSHMFSPRFSKVSWPAVSRSPAIPNWNSLPRSKMARALWPCWRPIIEVFDTWNEMDIQV